MNKLALAAAALMLSGCATFPMKQQPQVNRAAKADKYAAPKVAKPTEMPTPSQAVKKRWFSGYKVRLFHK
jgi:starvation-inducible outer membrane lipoprotein